MTGAFTVLPLVRVLDVLEGKVERACARCGQPNRRTPQRLCHDCHASKARLARAIAIANRKFPRGT